MKAYLKEIDLNKCSFVQKGKKVNIEYQDGGRKASYYLFSSPIAAAALCDYLKTNTDKVPEIMKNAETLVEFSNLEEIRSFIIKLDNFLPLEIKQEWDAAKAEGFEFIIGK